MDINHKNINQFKMRRLKMPYPKNVTRSENKITKHKAMKYLVLSFATVCIAANFAACAKKVEITKQNVIQAQKDWGNGIVSIGKCYKDNKNYKKAAKDLISNLYAYQSGQVLFKPTKASDIKFRTTKKGALSYFIGHNNNFPEDKGFALKPWVKVKFKNAGIYINDNIAMAMGKYFFTPQKGKTVAVEYTFGYVKNKNGKLKIVLHHSSLPYTKN